MTEATTRLRNHVASYKSLSPHRQNCLDVCDEVDVLQATVDRVTPCLTELQEDCQRQQRQIDMLVSELEQMTPHLPNDFRFRTGPKVHSGR